MIDYFRHNTITYYWCAMDNVISLDDFRAKKADKKKNNPLCPKCNTSLAPGVGNDHDVWVCTNCTTIIWNQ